MPDILKYKYQQNQNCFWSQNNRIEYLIIVSNLTKILIWQRDSLKRDPQVEHPLQFEPDPVDPDRIRWALGASGTAV